MRTIDSGLIQFRHSAIPKLDLIAPRHEQVIRRQRSQERPMRASPWPASALSPTSSSRWRVTTRCRHRETLLSGCRRGRYSSIGTAPSGRSAGRVCDRTIQTLDHSMPDLDSGNVCDVRRRSGGESLPRPVPPALGRGGWGGQPQVAQDPLDHRSLHEGGDDLELPGAAGCVRRPLAEGRSSPHRRHRQSANRQHAPATTAMEQAEREVVGLLSVSMLRSKLCADGQARMRRAPMAARLRVQEILRKVTTSERFA